MATVNPTVEPLPAQAGQFCLLVIWTLTTANADGAPVELPHYPDKTVQIEGTFGSGTLTMQGTNDSTNYQTLTDPQGNTIAKVGAALEAIQENPRKIRPNLTGSTGATVTVTMLCKGPQR